MKELVLTPGDRFKDGSERYTSHMILMVSYTLLLPSVCVVEVWRVGGEGGGREKTSCVGKYE